MLLPSWKFAFLQEDVGIQGRSDESSFEFFKHFLIFFDVVLFAMDYMYTVH